MYIWLEPLLRPIYTNILIVMAIIICISNAIRTNIHILTFHINNNFSTASNANMAMRIDTDVNQYQ